MKSAFFLILCINISFFPLKAQKFSPAVFYNIDEKLQNLTQELPVEKVFVQFDKTIYCAGENLWLKAYLSVNDKFSDTLSKVLYIDLINPNNQIVSNTKIKIEDSQANAKINLPAELSGGRYIIRGYTNWMRNFSADYFFQSIISVTNPNSNISKPPVTFQIFPQKSGDSIYINIKSSNNEKYLLWNDSIEVTKQLITDRNNPALLKLFIPYNANNKLLKLEILPKPTSKATTGSYWQIPNSNEMDLQFFPEGGYMVNGLVSRIAFKATGHNGKGMDIHGIIEDNNHNKVCNFNSSHLGMGVFPLLPQADKTYFAKVPNKKGDTISYPLPSAKEYGVQLSVRTLGKDLVRVAIPNNIPQEREENDFFLLVHKQSKVLFQMAVPVSEKKFYLDLPIDSLSSGIINFTLFNFNGKPLCERVIQFRRAPGINISIKNDSRELYRRKETKLRILTTDSENKPVMGNFSLSVVKADLPVDSSFISDIYSYTHLISEVKGPIESPNIYFKDDSVSTLKKLDFLLMTQGWRRYNWDDVLNGNPFLLEYLPEKGIHLNGKAERISNEKKPTGLLNLFISQKTDSTSAISYAQTDENGYFNLSGFDFCDTTNIFLQAQDQKGNTYFNIRIDTITPPLPSYHFYDFDNKSLSESANYYKSRQLNESLPGTKSIMLKEVSVVAKKKEDTRKVHSSLAVRQSVDVQKVYNQNPVRPEDIIGRFTNIQVYKGGEKEHVEYRGRPAIFVIDGRVYNDPIIGFQMFYNLPSQIIERVELVPAPSSVVYSMSAEAAICVFTKTLNDNYDWSKEGISTGAKSFKLAGYTKPEQFYSPKYDNPQVQGGLDIRNTLYWSPSIKTDANGVAEVIFYTSDEPGTYKIICEGVGVNNCVGTGTGSMEVKP